MDHLYVRVSYLKHNGNFSTIEGFLSICIAIRFFFFLLLSKCRAPYLGRALTQNHYVHLYIYSLKQFIRDINITLQKHANELSFFFFVMAGGARHQNCVQFKANFKTIKNSQPYNNNVVKNMILNLLDFKLISGFSMKTTGIEVLLAVYVFVTWTEGVLVIFFQERSSIGSFWTTFCVFIFPQKSGSFVSFRWCTTPSWVWAGQYTHYKRLKKKKYLCCPQADFLKNQW